MSTPIVRVADHPPRAIRRHVRPWVFFAAKLLAIALALATRWLGSTALVSSAAWF